MLHTLPPDLRYASLVCSLLGTAAPTSPGPAEHSAPYAGAVWYVKNDLIARDLKVETLEDFVKMLARRAFNRADAGLYTSLHNHSTTARLLSVGRTAPTRSAVQISGHRTAEGSRQKEMTQEGSVPFKKMPGFES
ncbi:hypothetical protein EVAR_51145_1 [Eumeta japonica]|uniref:Uncharacterized protein n=1 Tax=Eumeta variegata TaxID=151549 RepID=A0A4C1YNH2_EUMVA|nr:hypothetical protein EVAR_51145_1 [Eumeta japonica]